MASKGITGLLFIILGNTTDNSWFTALMYLMGMIYLLAEISESKSPPERKP